MIFQSLIYICCINFILTNGRITEHQKIKENFPPLEDASCITDPLMIANFIDGSGTYPFAIDNAMDYIQSVLVSTCGTYRQIIAGSSYDYFPYPGNVTSYNDTVLAFNFLNFALQPYKHIFDLQTSVVSFFKDPRYSAFDPRLDIPPWAIVYAFSNTVNGYNNFINGVTRLHNEGYMVLAIVGNATRAKIHQYSNVLPQANILSTMYTSPPDWITARIIAKFSVPAVNQTGSFGQITSPGYPNNYANFDLMDYYIFAPSNTTHIILTIQSFQTEEDSDLLNVYRGTLMDDDDFLYQWSGNMPPGNFTVRSSAVTLRFYSDATVNYSGFNITWTAI